MLKNYYSQLPQNDFEFSDEDPEGEYVSYFSLSFNKMQNLKVKYIVGLSSYQHGIIIRAIEALL